MKEPAPACDVERGASCSCERAESDCGASGERRDAGRGRTGLFAVGAAALACLVCLVPGAAVALGAAGVVAFTPAGIGGALIAAAVALVAWRLISRRRSAT